MLAAELGFEVLRARGSELEPGFAFGVVRQLFERRLAGAGPGEQAQAGAAEDGADGRIAGAGTPLSRVRRPY